MPNKKLNHQSAILRICVDQTGSDKLSGLVYSQRLVTPMPFSDMGDLLLKLEALMDEQRFPQAFQRIRSFTPKDPAYPEGGAPENAMTEAQVSAARGSRATFHLQVVTRQNATWQGLVDWLDGTKDEFSSDLEFLNLVEERMRA